MKDKFQAPLINFTDINNKLMDSDLYAGAFPRWVALSKAFNPKDTSKHTSAYAMIGVSK